MPSGGGIHSITSEPWFGEEAQTHVIQRDINPPVHRGIVRANPERAIVTRLAPGAAK